MTTQAKHAALPDLLTAEEVAEWLGRPVSTLYFWRQRKAGPPAVKIGKRLHYRATDVAAWLDDRAASSTFTTATASPRSEGGELRQARRPN